MFDFNMDAEDWIKLSNYVKNCVAKGFEKAEIRKVLLEASWREQDVEKAFSALKL